MATSDLGRLLRQRFREHDLHRAIPRRDVLVRERRAVEAELEAVARSIPFWSRLLFFHRTPDERSEKRIVARRAEVERSLADLERRIADGLAAVSREAPPFEVAIAVERIVRVGLTPLVSRGRLRSELVGLADRIVETWMPGLHLETLVDTLIHEDACRAAATRAPGRLGLDRQLGFRPVTPAVATAIVARRLLESPHAGDVFAAGERFAHREQLAALAADARSAVSALDQLNIFSTSPAERRRNELAEEVRGLEADVSGKVDIARSVVHAALAAFPPLEIVARIVEALGLVGLLTAEKEPVVRGQGIVQVRVTALRPVLFAALERVVEAWDAAFPDVSLPTSLAWSLSRRPVPGCPPGAGPLAIAAVRRLAARERSCWLRTQLLVHAAAVRGGERRVRAAQDAVSMFDRLLWRGRRELDTARTEAGRLRWHRRRLERRWEQLVHEARDAARTLPVFQLRHALVAAGLAVERIATSSSSSRTPIRCDVRGRDRAVEALDGVRRELASAFDVPARVRSLLLAAARVRRPVAPTEVDPTAPPRGAEAIRLVAGALHAADPDWRSLLSDVERSLVVAPKPTRDALWDKLLVEAGTEENDLLAVVGPFVRHVEDAANEALLDLAPIVDDAAEAFAPFAVLLRLPFATAALGAVRSVRFKSTELRSSGGKNKLVTVYRCRLFGRGRAVRAVEWVARPFVESFGDLPSYHRLLELWELDGSPLIPFLDD